MEHPLKPRLFPKSQEDGGDVDQQQYMETKSVVGHGVDSLLFWVMEAKGMAWLPQGDLIKREEGRILAGLL